MKYYAIINGVQQGPVEASALKQLPGFSAETPVWCKSMTDWAPASQVAELSWLFITPGDTPPPFESAPGAGSGYGPRTRPLGGTASNMGVPGFNPYGPDPARRPYNWMGWSIFNTVMGLLFGWISFNAIMLLFFGWILPIFGILGILGIVGIIFSAQAKKRYEQCDYAGAESSALVAKIVNIIGLVIISPVIILVVLILSA